MRIEEQLTTYNQVSLELFTDEKGYRLCLGKKDHYLPSLEKVYEVFTKQSSFDTIKLIHSGKKSYVHLFMDEVEVFDTKKALRRRLSLDSQGIWAEKRNGEKRRFFVEERGWFLTNYRQVSKDECRQKLERSSTMTKVLGVGLGILTLLPGAVEFARRLPIAPKEAAALGLIALNQRSPLLAATGFSLLPTETKAQALGLEFQVNTYTTRYQSCPSVAPLNDGGFIVTWQSSGQDGDSTGIYGQRYSKSGTPAGSEFQVNTYTTDYQESPSVAPLNDGGFVVTWASNGQDGDNYGIYGQRYDRNGVPAGSEFQVNTYTTDNQYSPSVAPLNDGGFVVTWQSDGQDGDGRGIYGQRFDSNGAAAGSEFQINTYTTDDQYSPSVAPLNDGGFIVTWESYGQDGGSIYDSGIYGQRFDSNGAATGSEFQINTYTTDSQSSPSVAPLNDGGFVVVWQSYGQDGESNGVFGQRYSAQAQLVGMEFQVNTYTIGSQRNPTIARLKDGGFVITWESNSGGSSNPVFPWWWITYNQDGSYFGIYSQRYDSNGAPVGSEFQVNTYITDFQQSPSVAPLNDGGFVVSWESLNQDGDGYGIFGQRFDVIGNPIGLQLPTSSNTPAPVPATPSDTPTPTSLIIGNSQISSSIQSKGPSSTILSQNTSTPTPSITASSTPQAASFSPFSTSHTYTRIWKPATTQQNPTSSNTPTPATIDSQSNSQNSSTPLPSTHSPTPLASRSSITSSSPSDSPSRTQPSPTTIISVEKIVYDESYPILMNGGTVGTYTISGGTGLLDSNNTNVITFVFNTDFLPEESDIVTLFTIPDEMIGQWESIVIGGETIECLEPHGYVDTKLEGASYQIIFEDTTCLNIAPKLASASLGLALHC